MRGCSQRGCSQRGCSQIIRFASSAGLFLVAAFVLGACGASLVRPNAEDHAWAKRRLPGTTLGHLQEGRALYVRKCSGCHNLRAPESRPPERWSALLDKMQREKEVPLGPAERAKIEAFLMATSARLRGGEAP